MGYKKNYDIANIYSQLNRAAGEVCSRYNDGYTAFYAKQDLYQILWHLESLLQSCPKFSGEEEFVKQHEQTKILQILKDEM